MLAKAGASADRVAEVIESADQVPESPHAIDLPGSATGLELRDVTFGYTADRSVLRGFDLVVRPGESVCLFGPSGAGQEHRARACAAARGRRLRAGTTRRCRRPRPPDRDLRSAVAYVPQDPWLLDATLAQNIAFGSRTATRAEVLAAGRTAWVDEFALPLPLGYDQPLGEGAATLLGLVSGGGSRSPGPPSPPPPSCSWTSRLPPSLCGIGPTGHGCHPGRCP